MALICARGGSKGLPGKNLRVLGGRPMIAWSIDSAKQCPSIDRVIVSTDCPKIAKVARDYKAQVPFMRPAELAEDNSPEWPVWQHALRQIENSDTFRPDYLVVLPPTSPFRSGADIMNGIKTLHEEDADIIISITESGRNPYFNMVELDHEGYAHLSKLPDRTITRRQDAPKVYDMTTVLYTSTREFVLNSKGTFEGRVKVIMIPGIRAVDIDTDTDLRFAEFLISEGMITPDENNIRTNPS